MVNKEYSIGHYYTPRQPVIKQSEKNVLYREIFPDKRLRNFIYCYWGLKTPGELQDSFRYRVVADGCIDIFFETGSPVRSYVMGFCKQFTEFPLGRSFHYTGVRFLPAAFPQLFNIQAAELSHRIEELNAVVPDLSTFISNNFSPCLSIQTVRNLFDTWFLNRLVRLDIHFDHRFYKALEIILKHPDSVKITRDLNTGFSQRQLRRVFKFYIGDTPKTFSKVVRFQRILNRLPSLGKLQNDQSFFDSGYYDQAHFIKEFRRFYGETPGRAFGFE